MASFCYIKLMSNHAYCLYKAGLDGSLRTYVDSPGRGILQSESCFFFPASSKCHVSLFPLQEIDLPSPCRPSHTFRTCHTFHTCRLCHMRWQRPSEAHVGFGAFRAKLLDLVFVSDEFVIVCLNVLFQSQGVGGRFLILK